MTTFLVYGSYGTLTVQRGTGLVLGYDPTSGVEPHDTIEPGEYDDIFRFDMPEWARAYPGEASGPHDNCDILDIGFWTHEGVHFSAEADYRQFQKTGDDGCFDATA